MSQDGSISVRPEREDDVDDIRAVVTAAFPTPAEAQLVDALRTSDAWIADLSLVAVHGDDVVGHALISRAHLDDGTPILALAPMAVAPEVQRRGIGGRLVRSAVQAARATGFPLIVVLGHAEYYPRFGFRPARAMGVHPPFDVPDDAWMALPLPAHSPDVTGTVVYPAPFGVA